MKLQEGSLKHLIFSHLRAQPGVKVNGGDIERLAQENGYKAETGDRRARELAQFGRGLMRDGKPGGYVLSEEKAGMGIASIWFWYCPTKYEVFHQERQQAALFS